MKFYCCTKYPHYRYSNSNYFVDKRITYVSVFSIRCTLARVSRPFHGCLMEYPPESCPWVDHGSPIVGLWVDHMGSPWVFLVVVVAHGSHMGHSWVAYGHQWAAHGRPWLAYGLPMVIRGSRIDRLWLLHGSPTGSSTGCSWEHAGHP